MTSPTYEKRQADKRLREQARLAAARLHGIDRPTGDVKMMHDGAFVEIVVWVPLAEILKEKAE